MDIETVKVKRDGPKGYHIINKSDFDPAKHELYEPARLDVGDEVKTVKTKKVKDNG